MVCRGLGDDLVVEILRRLPADHLRWSCRIVSKRWNALISSPYFRQLHQQQPPSPSSFAVFAVPYFLDLITKETKMKRAFKFNTESWKLQMPDENVQTYASCNGLLLFQSWNDAGSSHGIYIGNPITGELKSINVPSYRQVLFLRGFFYHSSKYRLLFHCGANRSHEYEYAILTLGSTEWTSLRVLPYGVYRSPVILNDTLYWMIDMENSIMMFCMDTEEFRTMSRPKSNSQQRCSTNLLEMEGRLTCWRSSALVVHAWVLELSDTGNHMEGHWTQIYNLDLNQIFRSYITPKALDHLFAQVESIQNGELILLWRNNGVFSYNLSTKSVEKIGFEGFGNNLLNGVRYLKLTPYTKTLASLNSF